MQSFFEKTMVKNTFTGVGILLIVGGIVFFGEYRRHAVVTELEKTKKELTATKDELSTKTTTLDQNLTSLKNQVLALVNLLSTEKNKSDAFDEKLGKVADTIGTLDALSKTDHELLEKYSKVYFLNEHYVPKELVQIDPLYLFDKTENLQIHASVSSFIQKLLFAGNQNGLQLEVASAYRSFGAQASLKSNYKVTYGAGTANQFSADQGYSEHQLGTALDFTTPAQNGNLIGFEKTPEYAWLALNAHIYGFILSYPEQNKYYIYEPWHWRFVGVDLAERLYRENKYFYDLDQREIDEYLSVLFNQ